MRGVSRKETKPYFSIGLLLVVLSSVIILSGGIAWFAILSHKAEQAGLFGSKPGFFSVGPVLPVLMGVALIFMIAGIWLLKFKRLVEDIPVKELETEGSVKPDAVQHLDMIIPVCAFLGAFLVWAFIQSGAIGAFIGGFIGVLIGQLIQWIIRTIKKHR